MQLKSGEKQMSILEEDFKIKIDKPLARKPIGFVMRGGFSQARGKGMAFGMICSDQVKQLVELNQSVFSKTILKTGKIALFRKPNSLIYQPCWLNN